MALNEQSGSAGGRELTVCQIAGVNPSCSVGFPQGLEVADEVVIRAVQGGSNGEQPARDLRHSPGEVAGRRLDLVTHERTSGHVIEV